MRDLLVWFARLFLLQASAPPPHAQRSVAVVGAGSAGLAMLRALVDLDSDLDIVVYEQRRDVGGLWLPDPHPIPPILPETPLYPLLHTNLPVATMTFPGFPFPPGTPLFASHEYIQRYHSDFATEYNLMPYIHLHHTVLSAAWVGSSEQGYWDIVVADQHGHRTRRSFDHLVVANGRNHYPHVVSFPGQDTWLQSSHGEQRQILHSIFYREPDAYANQTVIVVGAGASGRDVAAQVVLHARKVYQSVHNLREPASAGVEVKPAIDHFTSNAVVFADGSRTSDVNTVILATGYDLRVPFLETTGEVAVKPRSHTRTHGLTTNAHYLFPLHQHIFSLSTRYPPNALAFIGLPIFVAYCATDYAQSIYAAHVIANASLLGPRESLLAELDGCEDDVRALGYDPYDMGHHMVEGASFDYQELLLDKLKAQGAIPDDGRHYAEAWRRAAPTYQYLKRGWARVEALGRAREWLAGVATEAEWADMMARLNAWQRAWEGAQGLVFPQEQTVF